MFDLEKTLQGELKTTSMTWEEAKRTDKDRERWKLVVRALCSRGNDEEKEGDFVTKKPFLAQLHITEPLIWLA